MTAEEAYQARLRRSQMMSTNIRSSGAGDDETEQTSSIVKENKIKKMMEAMGWKGKGLGKQEQGIINPLIAKKTDAQTGFIVESQITN